MDLSFETDAFVNSAFLDFLLALLKPTSLEIGRYYNSNVIVIKEAKLISLEELERIIKEWHMKRYNETDLDIRFKEIKLSSKEKSKYPAIVTFENVFNQ